MRVKRVNIFKEPRTVADTKQALDTCLLLLLLSNERLLVLRNMLGAFSNFSVDFGAFIFQSISWSD